MAGRPDILAATSLPFELNAWTLNGEATPSSAATRVQITGIQQPQTATLPLDFTIPTFPERAAAEHDQ